MSYICRRVLNNSVVLAEKISDGSEVILLGKGIGVNVCKHKNAVIPPDKIQRFYELKDHQDNDYVSTLVNHVSAEVITITLEIISQAEKMLKAKFRTSLLLTIIDHLSFAIERSKEGLDNYYPYLEEMKILLKDEYEVCKYLVSYINHKLNVNLKEDEAMLLAIHFASARTDANNSALYSFSPIAAGAIIGGVWQVLIIVGMHIAILGLVSGPNISKFGRDQVIMTHAPSLVCQIVAGLAVSLKAKDAKLKRDAFTLSLSSLISGSVIEPVMYGVNLKLKKPFIAVLIGGAVGGAITGASGAGTTAAVALSIYSFPAYLGEGFGGLLIGCAVGALTTFLLIFFMGFDESLYQS